MSIFQEDLSRSNSTGGLGSEEIKMVVIEPSSRSNALHSESSFSSFDGNSEGGAETPKKLVVRWQSSAFLDSAPSAEFESEEASQEAFHHMGSAASASEVDTHRVDTQYRIRRKWRWRGRLFLATTAWQAFICLTLIFALFGPDVWTLCSQTQSHQHTAFFGVMLTAVGIFTIDIIIRLLVWRTYRFSFYFFLDLIGTLSLVWEASPAWNSNLHELAVARVARIARVSSRLGRVSRFHRSLRNADSVARTSKNQRSEEATSAELIHSERLEVYILTLVLALTLLIPLYESSTWASTPAEISMSTTQDFSEDLVASGASNETITILVESLRKIGEVVRGTNCSSHS